MGAFEFALDSLTQINLNSNYSNQQANNHTSDSVTITTIKPGINYLSSLGQTDNAISGSTSSLNNSLDILRRFHKKEDLSIKFYTEQYKSGSTCNPYVNFEKLRQYRKSSVEHCREPTINTENK
ncbi:MAG: hypothetical protein WDM78_13875 [Puia sp.]